MPGRVPEAADNPGGLGLQTRRVAIQNAQVVNIHTTPDRN